jgi:hypothetical protein
MADGWARKEAVSTSCPVLLHITRRTTGEMGTYNPKTSGGGADNLSCRAQAPPPGTHPTLFSTKC